MPLRPMKVLIVNKLGLAHVLGYAGRSVGVGPSARIVHLFLARKPLNKDLLIGPKIWEPRTIFTSLFRFICVTYMGDFLVEEDTLHVR